jgi:flagellar biosynthesis/type III secretory pathway chaperone
MSELKYVLENHLAALVDIQRLLAREMKFLLDGDENDIDQLATDKQRALDKLMQTAQGLEKFLTREGAEAGPAELARYIERACDAGELSYLRNKIGDKVRACAELNRTNGAVLECKRAASERALRVLLSPHCDPDRYRATGRLENIGARQSIGRA